MELAKIKACICEGAAEAAIIDVLLDNDLLIFQREEMLDEGVIRCRDGKTFETCSERSGLFWCLKTGGERIDGKQNTGYYCRNWWRYHEIDNSIKGRK